VVKAGAPRQSPDADATLLLKPIAPRHTIELSGQGPVTHRVHGDAASFSSSPDQPLRLRLLFLLPPPSWLRLVSQGLSTPRPDDGVWLSVLALSQVVRSRQGSARHGPLRPWRAAFQLCRGFGPFFESGNFFFRACRSRIVIWSGMLSWSRCYRGHDMDGVEEDARRRQDGSKNGTIVKAFGFIMPNGRGPSYFAHGPPVVFRHRFSQGCQPPYGVHDCSSLGHTRDCFGNCIVLPVYDSSVISASLLEPSQNNG
jgi:hypothetical protein